MKRVKILHVNYYLEANYNTPIDILKRRWKIWYSKYHNISIPIDKIDYQIMLDKAQSWHCLCALTLLLQLHEEFNEDLGIPKGFENA